MAIYNCPGAAASVTCLWSPPLHAPRESGLQNRPLQGITIIATSPPNSAFFDSPGNNLTPCCRCSLPLRGRHYMRTTNRTLVINLLSTILKSSEGKNHEDGNPSYGLD